MYEDDLKTEELKKYVFLLAFRWKKPALWFIF